MMIGMAAAEMMVKGGVGILRTMPEADQNAVARFRRAARALEGAVPEQLEHAAVAHPYAHVTAPLRRLVDRFGLVECDALSRGAEVPEWVREALPTLPEIMAASDRRAAHARYAAWPGQAAYLPYPWRRMSRPGGRVGEKSPPRNVRAPQGAVVANGHPG